MVSYVLCLSACLVCPSLSHTHLHAQCWHAKSCNLNCKVQKFLLILSSFSSVIRIPCRAEQCVVHCWVGTAGSHWKAKASGLHPFHFTLHMGHFLSWPSRCSERDRSQLTEGWELVNLKQVTVCMCIYNAKNTEPRLECPSDVEKGSLMKAEALSHIIQTYTHTTRYHWSDKQKRRLDHLAHSHKQTER